MKELKLVRAISVLFTLDYIENRVKRAICCRCKLLKLCFYMRGFDSHTLFANR